MIIPAEYFLFLFHVFTPHVCKSTQHIWICKYRGDASFHIHGSPSLIPPWAVHDRRLCSLHFTLHILYILGCNLHWCSLFYDGSPTLWTCEWDLLGPVIIDHIYCTSPLFIIAFCCKMSNLSICVLIPEKYGKIGDRITVNPIFGRCVLHVHLYELTTTSNTGWVGDFRLLSWKFWIKWP